MSLPPKPIITPAPDAPVRGEDQTTFATKANAFVAWMAGALKANLDSVMSWIDGANTNIETARDDANTARANAQQFRDQAQGFANDSADSASLSAASAAFKGAWSGLSGSLNLPASVSHNDSFWALLVPLADVTTSEPGVSADWERIQGVIRVTTTPIGAPDWPVTLTYSDGVLTVATYAQANARFRQTLSYDIDGNLESVLYEQSDDSGAVYTEIGTETLIYDIDGNLTGTTWAEV